MRTRLGMWIVGLAAVWSGCTGDVEPGAPATSDELLDRFGHAAQGKHRANLVALVNWEGVSDEMRAGLERSIDMLVEYDVSDVAVDPVPQGFKRTRVRNGLLYRPNVEVEGMFRITFGAHAPTGTPSVSMPFGSTERGYFVAGVVTEPTVAAEKGERGGDDMSLNIAVVGVADPGPVEFEGRYTFMASSEEFSEVFTGTGNLSKAFWGQVVTSCSVRRTSGDGWIQLRISQEGERVFASDRVTDGSPIEYELASR